MVGMSSSQTRSSMGDGSVFRHAFVILLFAACSIVGAAVGTGGNSNVTETGVTAQQFSTPRADLGWD
ncbi:hypothetical protein ACFYNY_10310 [Streptomyces sp. NPDC006530]|uniref:hypothetical protein n=1 Tax=Streptomyces sp. NPDC006530 TaxID=3364750 RepID=UPI00369A2EB0